VAPERLAVDERAGHPLLVPVENRHLERRLRDPGRRPGEPAQRGFEPATPRGFTRPSTRVPEPAFQVAVLDGHEEWMAGALVYCEPFWRHDCVGLRDPELARIEQMFET